MRKSEVSNRRIFGALHRWAAEYRHGAAQPARAAATGQLDIVKRAEAPVAVLEEPSRDSHEEPIEAAPPAPDHGGNFQEEPHAREEHQETRTEAESPQSAQDIDWYEVLQISRNADQETIQRVYRIMAARFHPDNPKTGDMERFLLMTRALHVLSDPARRVQYDRMLKSSPAQPMDVFEQGDVLDGVEGEKNRRLGILSLLYQVRRLNDARPGLALLDLEQRMALPREYLAFTLWYLRSKGYVHWEENSDYSITAPGIDYVEAQFSNRVVRYLLNPGSSREVLFSMAPQESAASQR